MQHDRHEDREVPVPEPPRYDFSNFFAATVADFALCEVPDRVPDYVSFSGSAYWCQGRSVRRLSDHWGSVASCKWLMEGRRVRAFLCGECPYDEFRPVWTVGWTPEIIRGLENR